MLNLRKIAGLLMLFSTAVFGQCNTEQQVRQLDAQWEKALLTGEIQLVEPLLHEDFIWVHNHAASIQKTKAAFLPYFSKVFGKVKGRAKGLHPNARSQRNVEVIITPSTAVIHGFTNVLRGNAPVSEPDTRPVQTYHFMRTYVSDGAHCLLVANHTMLLPNQ